jgi:hypothetical protein
MVFSAAAVPFFPIAVAAVTDNGTSVLPFAIIPTFWRSQHPGQTPPANPLQHAINIGV